MINIQMRRGTAATWTAANTVLLEGEHGFETDTGREKIGNGISAWNALSYSNLGKLCGVRLTNPNTPTTSGGVVYTLQFTTESYDTDGLHSNSTNPTRIIIPAGFAGVWAFGASVPWVTGGSTNGDRATFIYLNGSSRLAQVQAAGSAATPIQVLSSEASLAVGDYMELQVWQSSGGNLVVGNPSIMPITFWASYRGSL